LPPLSTIPPITARSPAVKKRGRIGRTCTSFVATISFITSPTRVSAVTLLAVSVHVVRLSGSVTLNSITPFSSLTASARQ